jgi:C4-type Zn-finger protein
MFRFACSGVLAVLAALQRIWRACPACARGHLRPEPAPHGPRYVHVVIRLQRCSHCNHRAARVIPAKDRPPRPRLPL